MTTFKQAGISVTEDVEEQTEVDSPLEAAVLGALPAEEVSNDASTPEVCGMCGRVMNLSEWQRGVNHALQRLYFQLKKHMDPGIAKQIVFKLQKEDVEL